MDEAWLTEAEFQEQVRRQAANMTPRVLPPRYSPPGSPDMPPLPDMPPRVLHRTAETAPGGQLRSSDYPTAYAGSPSPLSPVAADFMRIPMGRYNDLYSFVVKNPTIVSHVEFDALIAQAQVQDRAGETIYAQRLVHHALLIRRCRGLRPDQYADFFSPLGDQNSIERQTFADDVQLVYDPIHTLARTTSQQPRISSLRHQGRDTPHVVQSNTYTDRHNTPQSLPEARSRHEEASEDRLGQGRSTKTYPVQDKHDKVVYRDVHRTSLRPAGSKNDSNRHQGESSRGPEDISYPRKESDVARMNTEITKLSMGQPYAEGLVQGKMPVGASRHSYPPEDITLSHPPRTGVEQAGQDRSVIRHAPSRARQRLADRLALHKHQDPHEASASSTDLKDLTLLLHNEDDRDMENLKKKLSPGSPTASSSQELEKSASLLPSDWLKENHGAESDVTDTRKYLKLLQEEITTNEANTERLRLQLNQKEEMSSDKQDYNNDNEKEPYVEIDCSQGKADHAGRMAGGLKTYSEHQLPVRSKSYKRTLSWPSRLQVDECNEGDSYPNLMEAEEGTQSLAFMDGSPPTLEGDASFTMPARAEDYIELGDNGLARQLQDLQSTIARRFIRRYCLERGPSTRSPGSDPTTRTEKHGTYQAQGASSRVDPADSGRRSKRARSNRDNGDGDDEEEDHRKRGGHQPSRNSGSENSSHELFACPYSKFDPDRYSERNHNLSEKSYRGCSSSFLRDISRVKQHLYRVHKRPDHYCGSCFCVFETQVALDTHTRQRPVCENSDAPFSEKMTVDQSNSVNKRRYGKDARETWFNIYAILFPNSSLPASPYCEAASSAEVLSFSQRFRNEAPPMLSTLVRTRIQDSIPLEQYEQQILDNALEEALSEVILQFGPDFKAAELSTTGPSANPPMPDLSSLAASKDSQSISDHCLSAQIVNHQNPISMQSTSSSSAHLKTRGHLFLSCGSPTENDIPEIVLPSSPIPETVSQDLSGTNVHSNACSGPITQNCYGTHISAGTRFKPPRPKQFARNPTSRANGMARSQNPRLKIMAQNAYAANANTWLWSRPLTGHGIDMSYNANLSSTPQSYLPELADKPACFDSSAANFDLDLFETFTNSDALVERPL